MRLSEEKTLLYLKIVSLILLLAITVYQIADYKISKHKSECIVRLLALIQKYNLLESDRSEANFFTLFQLFHSPHAEFLPSSLRNPNASPEEMELLEKLESEKVTLPDFLKQIVPLKKKKVLKLLSQYNTGIAQLDKDIKEGTCWSIVRSVVVPLQFTLIVILFLGYAYLHGQVSQRVYKKRSTQQSPAGDAPKNAPEE